MHWYGWTWWWCDIGMLDLDAKWTFSDLISDVVCGMQWCRCGSSSATRYVRYVRECRRPLVSCALWATFYTDLGCGYCDNREIQPRWSECLLVVLLTFDNLVGVIKRKTSHPQCVPFEGTKEYFVLDKLYSNVVASRWIGGLRSPCTSCCCTVIVCQLYIVVQNGYYESSLVFAVTEFRCNLVFATEGSTDSKFNPITIWLDWFIFRWNTQWILYKVVDTFQLRKYQILSIQDWHRCSLRMLDLLSHLRVWSEAPNGQRWSAVGQYNGYGCGRSQHCPVRLSCCHAHSQGTCFLGEGLC